MQHIGLKLHWARLNVKKHVNVYCTKSQTGTITKKS